MKKVKTLPEGREIESSYVAPRPGRRVGNTTRCVDRAIDLLWQKKVVFVRDHYFDGSLRTSQNATSYLLKMLINRLNNEGPYQFRQKGTSHYLRFAVISGDTYIWFDPDVLG